MDHAQRKLTSRTVNCINALLLIFALIACGGGNSNDGIKSYPTVTIKGTAATGAPIANAPLTLKCAGSTASDVYTYFDTTDANGTYSKRVDAASAPCVISVDYNDSNGASQTLSSYAEALSSNTVANITPLTNAVLSAMMGTLTSTYTVASGNDTLKNLQTALQQDKDQVAWSALKGNLTSRGIDTNVITGDPVSDSFSADPSHIGQGYDKLLDDIKLLRLESPQLYQLAGGVNRFETVALTNNAEVEDKLTGLIWQRCVVGKVWNGTTCSGSSRVLYWSELPQLVADTSLSPAVNAKPWRLPTYTELLSLHGGPAPSPYIVDKTWFPAASAYWTWTSTLKFDPTYPNSIAMIVNFNFSAPGYYFGETTDRLVARLVR